MAVFRIERTRDYTVMSNHHLRNGKLSLKAKGLLSMMLSLPEDWNYTTRGLAKICKEGTDSIGSALKELEQAGFIRTIPAKGSYVAEKTTAQIREGYLAQIEEHFSAVLPLAASCGLGEEELVDLLRQSYQADQDAKGGPR